jgi:hypothetical protein
MFCARAVNRIVCSFGWFDLAMFTLKGIPWGSIVTEKQTLRNHTAVGHGSCRAGLPNSIILFHP